jgi:hypothetical protein
MSLAEKLEQLARKVPGVAGYQDKEAARETDKSVRLCLAEELDHLRLDIEKEKKRFVDEKEYSLLPALDTLTSKLEKIANLIRFASRGYSGIFDDDKVDQSGIERLYSFDLGIFDRLEGLKLGIRIMRDTHGPSAGYRQSISQMDEAADSLEKTFLSRQHILFGE